MCASTPANLGRRMKACLETRIRRRRGRESLWLYVGVDRGSHLLRQQDAHSDEGLMVWLPHKLPRRPPQGRWRLGALRPEQGPSLLLAAPVPSSTSPSVLPLAPYAPVAPVARRRQRTLGGSARVRFGRKLVSARKRGSHRSSRFPLSKTEGKTTLVGSRPKQQQQ